MLTLAAENPNATTADDVMAGLADIEVDLVGRRERTWLEIPPYAVHRLVYEPAGVRFARPFEEIELAFWRAAMRVAPVEGAVAAVRDVAGRGIPLAVVSNSTFTSATLAWQLGELGLRGSFEFVMSSGDYVVRKPHPLIFQTAARKLGVDADALWHVGDSLAFDVAGASSAGIRTIWFNPDGATADITPDHEISAWPEFAALIA